jgi:hypothetical protein
MYDYLAGDRFRLPAGNSDGCFQVLYLSVASACKGALTATVTAKVEKQNIKAVVIFEHGYRAQNRARNAVAMTDNDGWSRAWLRPEIALQ